MTELRENEVRHALVTGGASGIGLAICRAFAERGATVYALDRSDDFAEPLTEAERRNIKLHRCDLADRASILRSIENISRETKTLDVLVNNAGIGDRGQIGDIDDEIWQQVITINLTAVFRMTQVALPLLRTAKRASIVNIASVAGKRLSYSGSAAYTASKAGVLGFTRHAAFDLAREGIRVNAICPGPVLTPMLAARLSEKQQEAVAASVPLQRFVAADDIARAVLFLAGPDAANCTGTSFEVDGGVLIGNGGPLN
ncbi:MAG: SDR family oxidoreductase [Pseudomonadota bacterium]